MELDSAFASDVALLATSSALLHYAVGFYGLVAAVALAWLVANGAATGYALSRLVTRGDDRSASDALRKDLRRQKTWRATPQAARAERSYSDGWIASSDDKGGDDYDHDHREPSVEARDRDATSPIVPPALSQVERLRMQLLARLSIRDVGSSASSSAPSSTSPSSSAASTSSAFSAAELPPRLVAVNARTPVAFETELFVGHVLFLVRTAPEDAHYAHLFAGKRRMFWIQVQGRFKRRPRGAVFLGGELPGRTSWGFFTRSAALVIMGIIQSLVGKVYMSFGGASADEPHTADTELPVVSFPLYQSVDQFMVTPEGEAPPPLGLADFGESAQARMRRRQTPLGHGDQVFDVGPTYSFDFHTMYVDLTHWKTANLPGLSDMQLTTFFDSLPLRLVAYDVVGGERHLQRHKQYLFNFEVAFDALGGRGDEVGVQAHAQRRLWRSDSEQSITSSSESTGTAASVGSLFDSSAGSPYPTVVAGNEDQAAVLEALATVDQENACALRAIRLQYLFWIEELDVEMGVRRVQYVFRLQEHESGDHDEDGRGRIVVVSAYKLRLLLGTKFRRLRRLYTLQSLRFHARSRIDSYSTISDEALLVTACLQRLLAVSRNDEHEAFSEDNEALVVAFESALYQILTARAHLQLPHDGATLSSEITPAAVGVKLSKCDRDDLRVAFEGVVYRFYADSVARQEVMVLTADAIHFYRSQSSRPDKSVSSQRVIGVQATSVPNAAARCRSAEDGFAFALQINTFAEEIVLCVPSEHARSTWVRVILQHCSPHDNFDRSLEQALLICYTPTLALKPANRVVLNSRSLFPRALPPSSAPQDALRMVQTALSSAQRIHRLGQGADAMSVLDFLNHASALRSVDLEGLLARPHEERLAFFLNLYHVVLAHAMISHGFPRTKSQWESFQTHMCYAVGKDAHHSAQPLSLSLAEIEHLILRARLPPATGLPHLRLDQLPEQYAARLAPFGIAHPDFRVSFALLMNRGFDSHMPVFDAATLHDQLNAVVKEYVARDMRVDKDRQTIFLPRICEWFKDDFGGGGSALYCVRKLLGYMAERVQQDALDVLDSPTLVHIKYGAFQYMVRSTLSPADQPKQCPREPSAISEHEFERDE